MGPPHLDQWLGVVEHACHPRYHGLTNKRITAQASEGMKRKPISKKKKKKKEKVTNTKRAGRVALPVPT
jgi:hypothetical protein